MCTPGRRLLLLCLAGLLGAWAASPAWAAGTQVRDVRLWSGPEGTRLVVELTAPAEYTVFPLDGPDRVVIDLANTSLSGRPLPAGQGPVKAVRSGPQPGNGLRLVLDLDSPQPPRSFLVGPEGGAGHRLVVEMPGRAASTVAAAPPPPAAAPPAVNVPAPAETRTAAAAPAPSSPAEPAYTAVKSVASAGNGRELVIAIDAGHGGQDPGAIGRGGTREKDITLAIARRLAAAIDAEDGMRAVLTRDGDYFLTLGTRTRKARQLGADMFISVHADSVLNREVSGSSVYVLSLRGASDEAARLLAAKENAADLKGGVALDQADDVLASVLLDVTQKEAISASVAAADSVLAALRQVGYVRRPRVQHAGFVVLKSPDIPSMLVETAFISNASDEKRLRDADHQRRIAHAIRDGVRNYWYENPPPGTRVAALAAARRGGVADSATVVAGR
jgi:N-acetylmuramoyl-L-alanine amidase